MGGRVEVAHLLFSGDMLISVTHVKNKYCI